MSEYQTPGDQGDCTTPGPDQVLQTTDEMKSAAERMAECAASLGRKELRQQSAFIKHLRNRPETVGLEPESPPDTGDPWAFRRSRMICRRCMFYARKDTSAPRRFDDPEVGRCRRHAPTMGGYPVVFGERDWCGDFKLDEERA